MVKLYTVIILNLFLVVNGWGKGKYSIKDFQSGQEVHFDLSLPLPAVLKDNLQTKNLIIKCEKRLYHRNLMNTLAVLGVFAGIYGVIRRRRELIVISVTEVILASLGTLYFHNQAKDYLEKALNNYNIDLLKKKENLPEDYKLLYKNNSLLQISLVYFTY